MADCNDPNLLERTSRAVIPVGCAVMAFIRRQRRPGSTVTAALIGIFGAVQIARERKWPRASWWEPAPTDSVAYGQVAYITLALLTSVATLFVVVGFRRLLAKGSRANELQTAAASCARLVQDKTTLKHDEYGVNIWLVKGPWGFRRLVGETTVAKERKQTPITWTKGKGIIGQAWARDETRFANLDEVRAAFPTQRTWCELDRNERFRLSWAEFRKTSQYRAVLAVPLRRHRFARHTVRGVVAIDSLVPQKGKRLNGLQKTAEFSAIIRICEASFARDD